jgi:ATP-dependent DNA helicase PIF1
MGDFDFLDEFDQVGIEASQTEEKLPEVGFITGCAGTGKTYTIRKRIEEQPNYGLLCATTGIAAVNLGPGVRTLNSALGYYNTESLRDNFSNGKLMKKLVRIAEEEQVQNLIVDEVSMMEGEQLDLLHAGLTEVNSKGYNLGLILTGDFCQLPPVGVGTKGVKWAFEADCWERFEKNTTQLTKVWRQDGGTFLDALNAYRKGDGATGAKALIDSGVTLARTLDDDWDGVTIQPKNDLVDSYNQMKLMKLPTDRIKVKSSKWAADKFILNQWKDIPAEMDLKIGARVMVLANDTPGFNYVNGDVGEIQKFDFQQNAKGEQMVIAVWVKLNRTHQTVRVPLIIRQNTTKVTPDRYVSKGGQRGMKIPHNKMEAKAVAAAPAPGQPMDLTYFDEKEERWVTGEVLYLPVRLGWATTVHKSQGLTLTDVQVDIRDRFFGAPAMAYVAFSRCKTPQGLRIVGTEAQLAERCSIDPKVERWL